MTHGFCANCGDVLLGAGYLCDSCQLRGRIHRKENQPDPYHQTDVEQLLEGRGEGEQAAYLADLLDTQRINVLAVVVRAPLRTAPELEALEPLLSEYHMPQILEDLLGHRLIAAPHQRLCRLSGEVRSVFQATTQGIRVLQHRKGGDASAEKRLIR